jgi:transposase
MAFVKTWEISDALWEKAKPLIPVKQREKGRKYKRAAGGGRPSIEARRVFSGIFFVLRTGIQWKALPERFGSASAVHRYFLEWQKAGFFEAFWRAGLAEYDEAEGIAWDWQSIDGQMNKAPLAIECVGPNPTDRGKKWTQEKRFNRRSWRPAFDRRQRSKQARLETS